MKTGLLRDMALLQVGEACPDKGNSRAIIHQNATAIRAVTGEPRRFHQEHGVVARLPDRTGDRVRYRPENERTFQVLLLLQPGASFTVHSVGLWRRKTIRRMIADLPFKAHVFWLSGDRAKVVREAAE